MGAGAGAAAAIDNEPSPRGSAIEKAQAELRRDLAVREERRRELDFLEKGGEPLDFKFGETPLAHCFPLSPEPLADHLLKRGGEVGLTGDVLANGYSSSLLQEHVEGVADEPLAKRKLGTSSSHLSCRLTETLDDLTFKKDSECGGEDTTGIKSQIHVKRNRHCSPGNGHLLSKEKVVGADRPVVEVESRVSSTTLENEGTVDMSYQILPQQSSHALPSKWTSLTSSQEFELGNDHMGRCGPVLEQHATDPGTRDQKTLPSLKAVQSAEIRVNSCVDSVDRERDCFSVASEGYQVGWVDKSSTRVQKIGEQGKSDALVARRHVEDTTIEVAPINSTRILEGMATNHLGNRPPRTEKRERTVPFVSSMEKGSDRYHKLKGGPESLSKAHLYDFNNGGTKTADEVNVSHPHTSTDVLGATSTFKNVGTVKKTVSSRGGVQSRVASRVRSGQDEKRVCVHQVKIKSEEGVAEDRAKPSATDAQLGGIQSNGAADSQEELRAEGQAGAVVGGVPRTIGQLSCLTAPPNCKYSGVLPWEKEEDPEVQARAEKQKIHFLAEDNKARDDFILEEAEHIKSKRKLVDERKLMKKSPEPSRRRAHWDFVLEEMAWMANDFMQESLWKRNQSARLCRSVALKVNRDEFLASELKRRQSKIASFLARAVNEFWSAAEKMAIRDRARPLAIGNFFTEGTICHKNDSEAVPMDVDILVMKEASEKSLSSRKAECDNLSGIQKYAVQFVKATRLENSERHWDTNGPLEYLWENEYPEEPLFYVVPMGSMEEYRLSVETERARAEEEHNAKWAAAAAEAEAEALAPAEVVEVAPTGADFGFGDFLSDGQDDELPSMYMGEGVHSRISKKKRKMMIKTNIGGPKVEGSGLQGSPYRSSDVSACDMGMHSPIVTGKRSSVGGVGSNTVLGSIPVKRARSSAANLRPRATHLSTSPGLAGHFPRIGLGSHSQQDDCGDILDDPIRGATNTDTPSSTMHGVGIDAVANKVKKKKKAKPFQGLSGSRPCEGGLSAGTHVKGPGGDSEDLLHYEQMKRKGDSHWPQVIHSPDGGLGEQEDMPGTPGSQGTLGHYNLKKQKSLKQNETACEAETRAAATASEINQQIPSVPSSKLLKQNSMRDRNRRVRANKLPLTTPTGVGIPWSASEDQAILALVHDLGSNWELVSDVLSSNSQIKGIYRKPKQCKDRYTSLMDKRSVDGAENSEDLNSLQPQGSKGNVRVPRVHGTAEEESLKHIEHIVQLFQKYRARKPVSESQEQKHLAPPHHSHGTAIAQFCPGGFPNPLELCDRNTNNGDVTPHSYPIQPVSHGPVLGPPLMSGGPGLRPPSGGLTPMLPGTNGVQLGQNIVSSSAAINAAAARDAQRFTTKLSPEEATRLRMATGSLMATGTLTGYNARRLQQQQAATVTAGLPLLSGLPNPNDIAMLPTSTSGGMLGGLSRSLSLPRAGLPGMGSPVVSSPSLPGLGGMLPPGGASNMSRRNMLSMVRMPNCPEDQRLQILQLQTLAQQGDSQAAVALSNLGGDMTALVSSPPQPFSPQHQHSQQMQQQHNQQQQHLQLQTGVPNQAYYAQRMKEHQRQQQQQQHLQHQQKQRLMGSHSPGPQSQHMLVPPPQPHVPILPAQQHLATQSQGLPQPTSLSGLQKQSSQQQLGTPPSQVPQPANTQGAPASPAGSGQSVPSPQQMPLPQQNQTAVQTPQTSGSAKQPQAQAQAPAPAPAPAPALAPAPAPAKQPQKYPQQTVQAPASRVSKGPNRGAGMMQQGQSPQTGLPNLVPGSASCGIQQVLGETSGQMQSGLNQPQIGPTQAPNTQSVPNQAGVSGVLQSQGSQLQSLPSLAPQHKGLQQQQQQQQSVQGGVTKQQQGSSSQVGNAGTQQSALQPSANQQPQLPLPVLPSQQPQQLQRRQVPQPQPQPQPQQSQRRLQTRHNSTTLGMSVPGQLGKTGLQQTGQGVATQMSPQPGHSPYQLGGTPMIGNPISMSNPNNTHGIPPTSALNSSTIGAQHPTPWKPNQPIPPLPVGIYNLTRTNSPGSCQVPAPAVPSGMHMPSYNGNNGLSPISSTGMPLGMAHNLAGVQGGPGLQHQKLGLKPGVNGRSLSGLHSGITSGGPRNQLSGSVGVTTGMGNLGTTQLRQPVTPSATGGLPSLPAVPAGPSLGVPAPGPGYSSVSSPMVSNNGQAHKPHGGHLSPSSSGSVAQKHVTSPATGAGTGSLTALPLVPGETTPASPS